ncbi:receptor-like protein EIX2 [Lactuca sativa]|uniref:receptor-like protein EIX2 n=1 Tax=Lactuca sativa TaxID=4236 RepID=UPI000CD812CF|nr:receptor-like protein EIX2 [Lactuca sativa]
MVMLWGKPIGDSGAGEGSGSGSGAEQFGEQMKEFISVEVMRSILDQTLVIFGSVKEGVLELMDEKLGAFRTEIIAMMGARTLKFREFRACGAPDYNGDRDLIPSSRWLANVANAFFFLLLVLLLETTAATNQLVAVGRGGGGDGNGVMKKCLDNERHALLVFKAPLQDPFGCLYTWRAEEDDCCNFLSGRLSNCLWNFKQLVVLNLEDNNLSGRLPPSIASLIKLEIGENLSRLYVLILRSNNFSGTIPLQLCRLPNPQILDLSINNLHGSIPSCLNNLTSMVRGGYPQNVHYILTTDYTGNAILNQYIDHAIVKWQGDEREFFRNLRLLKSIDLSSNNLTGQIPYQITNLYALISLNLSKNSLIGEIPHNIGQIKQLLTLDLSRNNLSGQIPSSLSKMSLLNDLDMSFNNLSGRIPTSIQLQSFPPSRYDGNAGLCGPPLSRKCPGDEDSEATSINGKSEDDGEDIDEVWGWFYIGGGTGFVTGFWIACGALLLNHRGRRAFFHFYDSFKDWVYVKIVVFIANLQRVRHT